MAFNFTPYKSPLDLVKELTDENDGLDDLVDEFYGERITDGWDGPEGYGVSYQRSPQGDKNQYRFLITKGDDLIDEWDEWIPIKRAQPQARNELLNRIRATIRGNNNH